MGANGRHLRMRDRARGRRRVHEAECWPHGPYGACELCRGWGNVGGWDTAVAVFGDAVCAKLEVDPGQVVHYTKACPRGCGDEPADRPEEKTHE
jgi:hypothetical protein